MLCNDAYEIFTDTTVHDDLVQLKAHFIMASQYWFVCYPVVFSNFCHDRLYTHDIVSHLFSSINSISIAIGLYFVLFFFFSVFFFIFVLLAFDTPFTICSHSLMISRLQIGTCDIHIQIHFAMYHDCTASTNGMRTFFTSMCQLMLAVNWLTLPLCDLVAGTRATFMQWSYLTKNE